MESSLFRIAFIATEIDGLMKTGGLADVARALPQELMKMGNQVQLICPCHPALRHHIGTGSIPSEFSLQLGEYNYDYRVHRLAPFGVPILAIDYPEFFDRQGLYDNGRHPYPDNGTRFAFFCMAALHTLQMLAFQPDIIHCNDWHTAMVPFYLRSALSTNPFFANTQTLLTLHNAAYQGEVPLYTIPNHDNLMRTMSYEVMPRPGIFSMLRAGILTADAINAVSPTYAKELLTPLGGHGLHHLFQRRRNDLFGIINGCDYQDWHPAHDQHIVQSYHAGDMTGKAVCKRALQNEFSLPPRDIPLFAMVSRLTEQKGHQLLLPVLRDWLLNNVDAQFVILGSGQPDIAAELRNMAAVHPQRIAFYEGYDEGLTHRMQAGADFFLMPSLFEPCGLTQMYAMAYGTVPIVRRVGGLNDTIRAYGSSESANGLAFDQPSAQALQSTMEQALALYSKQPQRLAAIQQVGMHEQFSWQNSAQQYFELYSRLGRQRQQAAG